MLPEKGRGYGCQSSTDFPRVLMVGAAPINPIDATGITLANLFSGWPVDNLAQIYDSEIQPSAARCIKHFRFSANNIPIYNLAKYVFSGMRGKKIKIPSVGDKSRTPIRDNIATYDSFSAYADIIPFGLPDELLEWVDDFRPDVIYSVLGNVRVVNLVIRLAKYCSIPVVPHFLDDWPTTLYRNKISMALPRYVLQLRLKASLDFCTTGLTISSDMAIEYKDRYGMDFQPFMNCVEMPAQYHLNDDNKKQGLVFGFIGGLHLNRHRYLLDIVIALQKLKDSRMDVSIVIHAPEKDLILHMDDFSKYSVVSNISSIESNKVLAVLSSFDVLVHVESFLDHDSEYTRLSISTKIPQYMSVGRPIFAYGPKSLSSIAYIDEVHAGIVVSREGDFTGLIKAASDLVNSSRLRCELGANGRIMAERNHNATKVRDDFRCVMSQASKILIK